MNPICCRIKDACAASGIGRTKLYEMMDSGEIQSVKIGKSRLVVWASLLSRLAPAPTPGLVPVSDERQQTTADTKVRKVRLRPRISV